MHHQHHRHHSSLQPLARTVGLRAGDGPRAGSGVGIVALVVVAVVLVLTGCADGAVDGAAAGTTGESTAGATASTAPSAPATASAPGDSRADAPASSPATAGTALAMLASLPVKGKAPKTGYDGDLFRWRTDTDHNGCDTRNDVLRRDLSDITLKAGTKGCIVLNGVVDDPYSGESYDFSRVPTNVDIDHVVARSAAWQTGAQKFTDADFEDFGNDPLNLLSVSSSLNRQKGDGDAATWLPPNTKYRCEYVARQIAIKHKYGLWVVKSEKAAMERVLAKCSGFKAFTSDVTWPDAGEGDNVTVSSTPKPAKRAPSESPSKKSSSGSKSSSKSSGGGQVSYANCTAVREAGAAPIRRGDPGYSSSLDRDGDGVGCE